MLHVLQLGGRFHILNIDTLRTVYFAYFHSVVKHGIIFWRNYTYADRVFMLQKRIGRIMVGVGSRSLCRSLFKKLDICPMSIHIFIDDVCCG